MAIESTGCADLEIITLGLEHNVVAINRDDSSSQANKVTLRYDNGVSSKECRLVACISKTAVTAAKAIVLAAMRSCSSAWCTVIKAALTW
jgi:hypothetical protein